MTGISYKFHRANLQRGTVELQTGNVDLQACCCTRAAALRLARAIGTADVQGSLANTGARTAEESDAGDSCDSTVAGSADETYQQTFKMSANIQALPPNDI